MNKESRIDYLINEWEKHTEGREGWGDEQVTGRFPKMGTVRETLDVLREIKRLVGKNTRTNINAENRHCGLPMETTGYVVVERSDGKGPAHEYVCANQCCGARKYLTEEEISNE